MALLLLLLLLLLHATRFSLLLLLLLLIYYPTLHTGEEISAVSQEWEIRCWGFGSGIPGAGGGCSSERRAMDPLVFGQEVSAFSNFLEPGRELVVVCGTVG